MRKLVAAFLTALIITAPCFADELIRNPHESGESRFLTAEERAKEKEILSQERKEHSASKKMHKTLLGPVYDTSHAGAVHFPTDVTTNGDAVALEDGSGWSISAWDRHHTVNWLATDQIVITQNLAFFSTWDYILMNQSSGANVRANLFIQPDPASSYTLYITGFNDCFDYIYLNDGSVWALSRDDHESMLRWCLNDKIIIGVNSDWDNCKKPNILINTVMQKYLRAKRIH